MERTLVISDIHGCYRELVDLLQTAGYRSERDRLLLLGDYVSRGPDSREVVGLAMRLVAEHGAIALQGNHDYRFARVILGEADQEEIFRFFQHGGSATLQSYCEDRASFDADRLEEARTTIESRYASHVDFLGQLPRYHEDEHLIYVHAGLNPSVPSLTGQDVRDLLFIKEDFYRHPTRMSKPVIFGHTIATDLHGSWDVWLGGDKIGIDGGCSFGGQLNGVELVGGRVNNVYVRAADRSGS